MESEIKQVDKQANSNGQATNPRIIIDASYIRGMKKDGAPLRAISEQGGRIVITDTLVYELYRTPNRKQWLTAKHKLARFRDAIEAWEHVPVMCNRELKENRPYGDPFHRERTERLREMLANDSQSDHSTSLLEREDLAIPELFQNFAELDKDIGEEITEKIKDKASHDNEVVKTCYALVNDPDNIRSMIKVIMFVMKGDINVLLNPNDVDKTWAIWHFSKSLLTVFCDCLRQGEYAFREISKKRKERLNNIIHDLDYLILLAFADAIASRETKGELFYYRRWMFGDASKPLISYYENERISLFVQKLRQMSKIITICVVEQLDGYTCSLDPWSKISPKIQNSEELPASVFISRGTKGHFELFHGSTWEHIAEILTGYSASELWASGEIVFVDPRTKEILFTPSAQHV